MTTAPLFANLAFISYSRKADALVAARLQADLERYAIPGKVACDRGILAQQRYLRPVFRDHTDLHFHTESFWQQIEKELAQTRFLILFCSPTAAASPHVNKEVEAFLASHDGDINQVLPIIVDGDITAAEGPTQCLPAALQPHRAVLLARNLPLVRDCTRQELMLKTASWMLRVQYDALYKQHRYRQGRQRAVLAAVASVVLCIIGGLAWQYWREAQLAEQRRIANAALEVERQRQADIAQTEERRAARNAYLGNIRLAARSIDQGSLDTALQALDAAAPEFRDWEWGYLRGEVDQSLFQFNTSRSAYPVAPSPDGKLLALAAPDQSVRVIALEDYQEVKRFDTGFMRLNSLAFSADGKQLAAASWEGEEGELALWDYASAKQLWKVQPGPLSQMQFDPSGARVIAATTEGAVLQFKTTDGQSAAPALITVGGAGRFACNKDGSRIAAIDIDGRRLFYFDALAGKVLWQESIANINSRADFTDVDISRDGLKVLVASDGAGVWLIDSTTGLKSSSVTADDARASRARFSPNGDWIAVGRYDGTVEQHHFFPAVGTSRLLVTDRPHTTAISALAFAHFERILLSAAEGGTLRMNTMGHEGSSAFRGHRQGVRGLLTTPKSENGDATTPQFVSWSSDQTVRAWSLSRFATPQTRVVRDQVNDMRRGVFPTTADVSPDGTFRVVRTVQSPNTALLLSTKTRKDLELEHAAWIGCVAFDTERQRILTGSLDHSAKLWDTRTGAILTTLTGHAAAVSDVELSADGRYALTGSADKSARIWSLPDGTQQCLLAGHTAPIKKACFHPQGDICATGDEQGHVFLWKTSDGTRLRALEKQAKPISSLQFSADGERLLTAAGNEAWLWEVDTGKRLHALTSPSYLAGAVLNAAGTRILTLCSDGLVGVWDAREGDHLMDLTLSTDQIVTGQFASDRRTLLVSDGAGRIFRVIGGK